MSACDRFVDRLYDEDARGALASGRAAPQDMQAHASECAACRQLWQDCREDLRLFAEGLLEAAPTHLQRRAARALRAELAGQDVPLIDWTPAAVWTAVGAALSACGVALVGAGLPLVWQVAVAFSGAAVALSAEVTRQGLATSGA